MVQDLTSPIKIRLCEEAFDVGALFGEFTAADGRIDGGIGGVCIFTGLVRDFNDSGVVEVLSLEHYPQMAEKQLRAIAERALGRLDLRRLWIIHRYGDLSPGDVIVAVLAAASHRAEAFDGCRFVMDYLKVEAPFWKVEHLRGGATERVSERDADRRALDKWQEED